MVHDFTNRDIGGWAVNHVADCRVWLARVSYWIGMNVPGGQFLLKHIWGGPFLNVCAIVKGHMVSWERDDIFSRY